jgi:hypothetical protein
MLLLTALGTRKKLPGKISVYFSGTQKEEKNEVERLANNLIFRLVEKFNCIQQALFAFIKTISFLPLPFYTVVSSHQLGYALFSRWMKASEWKSDDLSTLYC